MLPAITETVSSAIPALRLAWRRAALRRTRSTTPEGSPGGVRCCNLRRSRSSSVSTLGHLLCVDAKLARERRPGARQQALGCSVRRAHDPSHLPDVEAKVVAEHS